VKKGASRHVVVLDEKVWEDLRVKAIREHTTLTQLIEKAIRMELDRNTKGKSVDSEKKKKIN
jgi:hypothetical protein